MQQLSFYGTLYTDKRKRTRRELFLTEMGQAIPWTALLALIEPNYLRAGRDRRPYPLTTMLRAHLLKNWFGYRDPAMEEAPYKVAPFCRVVGESRADSGRPRPLTPTNR